MIHFNSRLESLWRKRIKCPALPQYTNILSLSFTLRIQRGIVDNVAVVVVAIGIVIAAYTGWFHSIIRAMNRSIRIRHTNLDSSRSEEFPKFYRKTISKFCGNEWMEPESMVTMAIETDMKRKFLALILIGCHRQQHHQHKQQQRQRQCQRRPPLSPHKQLNAVNVCECCNT